MMAASSRSICLTDTLPYLKSRCSYNDQVLLSKYIINTNKKSKCELILITTSLVLDKVSNLDLSGVEHYIFVVVNIVDEGTIALVLRPVVRPLIESTKLISVQIKLFQLVLENRR